MMPISQNTAFILSFPFRLGGIHTKHCSRPSSRRARNDFTSTLVVRTISVPVSLLQVHHLSCFPLSIRTRLRTVCATLWNIPSVKDRHRFGVSLEADEELSSRGEFLLWCRPGLDQALHLSARWVQPLPGYETTIVRKRNNRRSWRSQPPSWRSANCEDSSRPGTLTKDSRKATCNNESFGRAGTGHSSSSGNCSSHRA